jgi:hypothetical protein
MGNGYLGAHKAVVQDEPAREVLVQIIIISKDLNAY